MQVGGGPILCHPDGQARSRSETPAQHSTGATERFTLHIAGVMKVRACAKRMSWASGSVQGIWG